MNSEESSNPKRASGQRNKKRKFTGNMYTKQACASSSADVNKSASERKLGVNTDEVDVDNNNTFQGYRIIDINLLFSSLENSLCCKVCGSDVTFTEQVMCGLSSKILINCENCAELCSFRNSTMIGPKKNIPEINRRYLYAMRTIGRGYSSMKLFCGIMDLPQPISKKSYNSSVKKLLTSSSTVAQQSMEIAAREEAESTGSMSINVSGDGTWKTRGHTSRIGVCAVIGDKSGKVIDTEVLSSYCKACDTWKTRKGTVEYNDWQINHQSECLINHTGSAGKMEVVGMVRIFQRSEKKRNVKYVGYIGDGDTKTFQAITEASPYGAETSVSKIECVGHIQKRMGTRLRKLKQAGVKCSDGKSVGGKGRLTDSVIDKLTVYYGNAIREHKNSLCDMRKAVWAIYFHTRSTDSEPLHTFCPPGSDSWCTYQKAVSNGSVEQYKHKKTLPTSVMDVIKPIFNDLSQPKLLQRCLGGKTQNNNECLNSLIWKHCPKTQNAGKRIVEIATNEAVVLFNNGNKGRIKVMKEFGLTPSSYVRECLIHLDKKRIEISNLRFLQSTKEARKSERRKQKAIAENFLLHEGETYASGAF